MAAREFLMIVVESAYGTPKTTPVLGTDSIYCRLDGGNAFTILGDPEWYEVMYGGGFAVPAVTGSDQVACVGQLTTKLYGSQAVFMSNWFGQRINAAQTSPWTTTEPPGDLASCSVYHAVQWSDGSIKRQRYPGAKVSHWKVDISRESKVATLSLGLVAQKYVGNSYDSSADPTATEFPAPAESAYPTDPFRFIDLAGNVTIGTSRTNISNLSIAGANVLDSRWFESRFLMLCRCLGRTITADTTLLYKPSPDDVAAYQSLTAQATSFELNNGTHSITFNMNTQTHLKKLTRKLDLDKVYEVPLSLKAYWDPAALAGVGSDLQITAT